MAKNIPPARTTGGIFFEGGISTTVILTPGACRRGALSSTSCVCASFVAMSSRTLDFVCRHVTLEFFVCIEVPRKAAEPC